MKIIVIGGSGLIGSKLVVKLREQGHEAIAASPSSAVNTVTSEGLAEALKGASVTTRSPAAREPSLARCMRQRIQGRTRESSTSTTIWPTECNHKR